MANPSQLLISVLSTNGAVDQPAAQAIDTNGIVYCLAAGLTDRLFIEIRNQAESGVIVRVKASTDSPDSGWPDLEVTISAGAAKVLGPFESARYKTFDGSIRVEFEAVSDSPACAVRVYRLPRY